MEEKTDTAGVGVDEQTYSVPGLEGGVTKDGDRLMPEAQRESDTKTNVNPMSSEFGYYGELDATDSGIDPTADPRNYVFDDDEYFSDGPRRRGQTLEQQERAEGLNGELKAQHESNLQETDIPRGRRVWQPKERESRESDIREVIVEDHSKTGGLVSSRALEVDPREFLTQSELADVNHFAARLSEDLEYPRHVIAKRIAWKVAAALELADDDPLPLKFNDRPKDPFANGIGTFSAMEVVRDELLYELPRTAEGVKTWHKSCSIRGRVDKLWTPNNPSQRQAGELVDSEDNRVKFVVWERADAEMYGRDTFGLGITSYTLGNHLPLVREGDLIEISGGNPSKYLDIISIACSQSTSIYVLEKGDGPTRTRNEASFDGPSSHNPTARFDRKKVTDDHSDGVPSLAQKRYRPQWEVMARHGDFDKSDPENQPPSNPAKRRGITDKGWNFCETWTFPVSSWTPEWYLARDDVKIVDEDRPLRTRSESDTTVARTSEGGEYECMSDDEFLSAVARMGDTLDVEFTVADDFMTDELVVQADVPDGRISIYTTVVGGWAAPVGEDSIQVVYEQEGSGDTEVKRLYRVEGWESRIQETVEGLLSGTSPSQEEATTHVRVNETVDVGVDIPGFEDAKLVIVSEVPSGAVNVGMSLCEGHEAHYDEGSIEVAEQGVVSEELSIKGL